MLADHALEGRKIAGPERRQQLWILGHARSLARVPRRYC